MSTLRSLLTSLVVVALLGLAAPGTASAVPAPAPAASAAGTKVVTKKLRFLVRSLPVRPEKRKGYDRDRFVHWISQGGGCDTRDRVLYQEALVKPRVGADCAYGGGKWRSYYDGVTTSDPSTFDVDHLVALAEAWDSGARKWDDGRRRAYANDLGDKRTLVAVTSSSNRSKSDSDPAEWLPAKRKCRYVREWAAVKLRWSLSIDRAERRALVARTNSCPNVKVRVRVVE